MDASTRWETAAIRSNPRGGSRPPLPSARRGASTTTWVTLKEAEAATSVPVNTLRKWVRRADLPSYLESDGDVALRMVDLDAVVSRAKDLGRHIEPLQQDPASDRDTRRPDSDAPAEIESDDSAGSAGTMIVPIDAFNKMLSQLGNLHEAGQQLAEARERAAKAETEATFLRQRLAELRSEPTVADVPEDEEPGHEADGPAATPIDVEIEPQALATPDKDTTTYWRYLTKGWAERRRLRRTKSQ
ncbi:MAG: hypothetical protein BMS9Abin17_0943 [Acidimicrobiia bacterium]|nr:MAG: hypothetical protein BMS9Abin17_0943 [Acidimicrobiia bacterium]